MPRIRFIIFVLAIESWIVSACAQSPDCFQKNVFCAALVTDTRGLNDYGLNHDTWAGLQQSKADGVVDQIAFIESVNAKDYEKNINFFVNAGYDVIVTSNVGLMDATLNSADRYPDSVFVGINQPDNDSRANFISVTFAEDQMGFVAGVWAARLTKTKIIGAVCETSSIDSIWRYCEGFRAGASYADASIQAIVVYRDGEDSSKLFADEGWGFEQAQRLIKGGADVIFAAGGGTGVGALRAAGKAKIQSIGVERDQAAALGADGSGVLTSVLGQTSLTVQKVMRSLKSGNLPSAQMSPIWYIPFDEFVQRSALLEMENVLTGLESGEIKTNVPFEKP